jgi:copper chaperone
MDRRKFLRRVAAASGTSLTVAQGAQNSLTVTYAVEGFTCPACAVGLEVMLRDQKGVLAAKANYERRSAVIRFDPSQTTESKLQAYVAEMGFRVKKA